MNIVLTIEIIIVLALIIFIIWAIKKVFKLLFIAGLIVLLIAIVFGFYVYSDFNNLKENIVTTDSLFVLKDSDIHTGFTAKFSDQFSSDYEPYLLTEDDISDYNGFYRKGDLESIRGEYYKIFMIKESTFDDLDNVLLDGHNFTKDYIIQLLYSDNPRDSFASDIGQRQGISADDAKKELPELDSELKAILFIKLFGEKLDKEGPLFIIREFKKGNIDIYPNTAVVRLAKIFPLSYVDRFIEKVEV